MNSSNRLALGTVQFGLPYGIANGHGQISTLEAESILNFATNSGIDTLDTAIAYGIAEQRLGEIGVMQWNVISKVPPIPATVDVSKWINEQIEASLSRLQIRSLHGLLLHHPIQLLGSNGDEIFASLSRAKESGLVHKIGISSYSEDEIDLVMSRYPLDLIQAPLNIFDRRLIESGCLERIDEAGIEFHARSIFLQGLLLVEKTKRPEKFAEWNSVWNQWDSWLIESHLTPLQACLGFVLAQQKVSRIVVGVDSCAHLKEILGATEHSPGIEFPPGFEVGDSRLLNPSNWSLN